MLSVIILLSTYNGSDFIEKQLDSILTQTFKNFKIIIRDDGSTDNTYEILINYHLKYPDKIFLIEDGLGNLGSRRSFMKLLEIADTEYIMFCDQDDEWLPNKIEITLNQIKELEKRHGKDIPLLVFTDLVVVDQNLNTICESFWNYQKLIPSISRSWKQLLAQNVITGCTVMINKKAKEVCLPYELPFMMHDHWMGVMVAKHGKVEYINEQTVLYRQHGKNVAGANKFGFLYIKNKLTNFKNTLNFIKISSRYFNRPFYELFFLKFYINIKRLILK